MELLGVHHVAIKVADLARAEAFYAGVLGLPVIKRWPSADGRQERSLWLGLGGDAFLALERSGVALPPKSETDPGIHLLALRITHAQRASWIAKLSQAGHPIYAQTRYTIYVQDAEGNRIGLSHWPDAI